MRRAFTMVEILVTLGILALLAALLFPALGAARSKARQSACAANLQQIGVAITQYIGDWDRFPRGLDAADKYTPEIWSGFPGGAQIMQETPLLPAVLAPYIKDNRLWACPADSGFDVCDTTGLALDARPTCYKKFGLSYFYRTELMLRQKSAEDLPRAAQTHVLSDAAGAWHGGGFLGLASTRRYNVLYADGHSKNLNHESFMALWDMPLE